MARAKLYIIQATTSSAVSILGIVLLSACSLLAAELGDQKTTISPVNLHHANAATESHGSIRASERLMKELKEINKSGNYKSGLFSVELVNDNLYEWRVNLSFPDPECNLYLDLKKLKSEGKGEHVVLRISFGDRYPAEPPFVRIAYPALSGRWILDGGALCMKQLSKRFWSSEWSIESFILSIAGQLIEGNARINLYGNLWLYTDAIARENFEETVSSHDRYGWD